jgi:superoxide dismutase, Cu-Zn family
VNVKGVEMRLMLLSVGVAMLSACSTPPTPQSDTVAKSESVFARLKTVKGGELISVGQAQIIEQGGVLKLAVNFDNGYLPEQGGPYGMHIHAVGRCDAPDFTTAGPHWNPSGRQHGRDNPAGQHAGDLPNVNFVIGQPNSAGGDIAGATLQQLMDADGAAIIMHEKADDYKTDPSGNSGKRIVCGVFEKP